MAQKIKLEDKEYDVDHLSESGRLNFSALKFTTERIHELNNNLVLLKRAKKSYLESLKQEMLSDKAGFLFGDN